MVEKCKSCIGKYEYKSSCFCRYCIWNREPYWGRMEEKIIEDNYSYCKDDKDSGIPY